MLTFVSIEEYLFLLSAVFFCKFLSHINSLLAIRYTSIKSMHYSGKDNTLL
jgi:hypothetical protein